MTELTFVTGNTVKFDSGSIICEPFGIKLHRIELDVPEIQAEEGEVVARQKATDAFRMHQKPLIISDDSWLIPGLNNFPGPYMKSMNHWFTTADWLRLTSTLPDRTIILRLVIVYQDQSLQKLFSCDIPGILLHESRGEGAFPHTPLVSFDDGVTSLAENIAIHKTVADVPQSPWRTFAKWYTDYAA